MPWVKKRRRRRWYRRTNVKAYSVIILACIAVAAILSFVVERFPIFVDQLEESIIEDMARQLNKSAAPDSPVKLKPPLADRIDLDDPKQLEQLKKAYADKEELDDQDRRKIEDLKQKYADKMGPEELEKLEEKYRQMQSSDSRR